MENFDLRRSKFRRIHSEHEIWKPTSYCNKLVRFWIRLRSKFTSTKSFRPLSKYCISVVSLRFEYVNSSLATITLSHAIKSFLLAYIGGEVMYLDFSDCPYNVCTNCDDSDHSLVTLLRVWMGGGGSGIHYSLKNKPLFISLYFWVIH